MTDVFREVDEDLRHERMKALWDRFGPYVIGVAVLIVAVVGAYRGWQYWEAEQAAASGDRYLAAIDLADAGKKEEAEAAFAALIADGSGGYPVLARMRLAAAMAADGNVDGAVAAFDAVAADFRSQGVLRQTARLRAAILLADRISAEEMQTRIGDLAATGQPFRSTARELIGLSAMRAGNLEKAQSLFLDISADQAAPATMRRRAQVMLQLIAARQAPAKPTEVAPAPGSSQ